MTIYKTLALLLFVSMSATILNGQAVNLPLGNEISARAEHELIRSNERIVTGMKPVIVSGTVRNCTDTSIYLLDERTEFFKKYKERYIWKIPFFDDFLFLNTKDIKLKINPLLYVESGMLNDSTHRFLLNTRGVEMLGEIGERLSFYTSFYENYSEFRPYLQSWIANRLVVPGQGAVKYKNETPEQSDFAYVSSYINFQASNSINLQLGYGKHFIGDGYRSLLLSDNAFNYPYLRAEYRKNGFQYTTIFAEFQDFSLVYYYPHIKKHAAFNYLAYNFLNRIELGVFEGVIYQTNDTAFYSNKFTYDYFVPLIGLRTVAQNKSINNNALAGVNFKLKTTKSSILYGQYASDLQGTNRTAWQAGLKIYDVFHRKFKAHNMFIQAEYNNAMSSIFTHDSIRYQTWTHHNQELAHPFGTRFDEFVFIGRYSYKRISANIHFTQATTQSNSDIFLTENGLDISEQIEKQVKNTYIFASFLVNPRTNLSVYTGVQTRQTIQGEITQKEPFFVFGIRTGIANFYYDF